MFIHEPIGDISQSNPYGKTLLISSPKLASPHSFLFLVPSGLNDAFVLYQLDFSLKSRILFSSVEFSYVKCVLKEDVVVLWNGTGFQRVPEHAVKQTQ